MNNLVIRKAKKTDFEPILNLAKQLWDAEKGFSSNLKDDYYANPKARESLLKDISKRKSIFIVVEIDKNIVGFAYGYVKDNNDFYKEKIGYLDKLVVDEKHRRKGIAYYLMEEFSKIIKEKECAYLELNAFEKNTPAVECYKKYGFEEYSIFYMKKIR